MFPEIENAAWLKYAHDNGLSWLALPVQAAIKQAFFAGLRSGRTTNAADLCICGHDTVFETSPERKQCSACGRSR